MIRHLRKISPAAHVQHCSLNRKWRHGFLVSWYLCHGYRMASSMIPVVLSRCQDALDVWCIFTDLTLKTSIRSRSIVPITGKETEARAINLPTITQRVCGVAGICTLIHRPQNLTPRPQWLAVLDLVRDCRFHFSNLTVRHSGMDERVSRERKQRQVTGSFSLLWRSWAKKAGPEGS